LARANKDEAHKTIKNKKYIKCASFVLEKVPKRVYNVEVNFNVKGRYALWGIILKK
jgi:hypothetical protein